MLAIILYGSSNGSGVLSSVNAGIGGAMKLLTTTTVTLGSSVANVAFTSGIDSTYKEYIFVGINVHQASLGRLEWIPSDDGGSSYGINITSTGILDVHYENNASYAVVNMIPLMIWLNKQLLNQ